MRIAPTMMMMNTLRLSSPINWMVLIHILLQHFTNTTLIQATTYNHQTNGYNCDIILNPSFESIGPSFDNILPASNENESMTTLPEREYKILSYYAQAPLPINSSSDDFQNSQIPEQLQITTNPFFNSRLDVSRITRKYISRIILGCYNNTDMDQIFLDPTTRPFALYGSTSLRDVCIRDGDYDFAAIDIVQLLYVAQQYPNSMPLQVYNHILHTLLPLNGPLNLTNTFMWQCQADVLGRRYRPKIAIDIVETENHILQNHISQYLTNQLYFEANPINQEYNNTSNGITVWLLQYLSGLVKDYFYEYNSRPYQLYTVKALSVLHSYAEDEPIVLVTEILLDIITSFSAIQMNSLRRFAPYRRQPSYVNETISWKGDSEYYRLAILVGNYRTILGPSYTIPGGLGSLSYISTIATKYRVNDMTYQIFFRGNNNETDGEYFISNHDVVEMYYSQRRALISGGGHETKADILKASIMRRFCLFPSCIWERLKVGKVTGTIYSNIERNERGWSRPTTIIPSNEPSDDLLHMIRFQGHRSSDVGATVRNLCVGPNFACGLQLLYGKVVESILDTCSVVLGDWRFIDFTTKDCLNYGYYMAVYRRSCNSTDIDECIDTADNYGLLEISEPTMSFAIFQQAVLSNNPTPFVSKGIHMYVPISGAKAIQFEIHPQYDYQSQILAVDNIFDNESNQDSAENTIVLDRIYRNYPRAWSSKGSFQSISAVGRWTFDGRYNGQRCICDVTDPLRPIRITSKTPTLRKYPMGNYYTSTVQLLPFSFIGQYFDDSTSVLDNDTIQSIQFHWNRYGVAGFLMKWRTSGLQSMHGYVPPITTTTTISSTIAGLLPFGRKTLKYELDMGEYIVSVGIGSTVWLGLQRVHRIRLVTNKGRTFIIGYGKTEDMVYDVESNDVANHIISFYGRASDDMVYQLGVTTIHGE
jgi:hypothetical protein